MGRWRLARLALVAVWVPAMLAGSWWSARHLSLAVFTVTGSVSLLGGCFLSALARLAAEELATRRRVGLRLRDWPADLAAAWRAGRAAGRRQR